MGEFRTFVIPQYRFASPDVSTAYTIIASFRVQPLTQVHVSSVMMDFAGATLREA